MKNLAVLFIILLILGACASTPETDTTVPAPEQELAEAKSLKSRVDKFGLGDYAAQAYAQAEQDLKDGEAAYNKDNTKAKASLDAAITGYNTVLSEGFTSWVGGKNKKVSSRKKQPRS